MLGTGTGEAQDELPADKEPEPAILGVPAGFGATAAGATHLAEPGSRLYSQPDPSASVLAMIDVAIELTVLARRGSWVQVRYASLKGWLAPTSGPPVATVAARLADIDPELTAWRLTLAREILGQPAEGSETPADLGSFRLLTDVVDRRVLAFLARIAERLPAAYSDRFGLASAPLDSESVVLFADEADYRTYESRVRPETDRGTLGHADHGLAVLFIGRQGPADVAAVLVHELTHVLNRRHLLTAPAPWLEEGMAHDLAFCEIDGLGRLELGTLGGRSVLIAEHFYRPGGYIDFDRKIHLSGPRAALRNLRQQWLAESHPQSRRLERLTDLIGRDFFDPEGRAERYDVSTFFLRYLLDGEDGMTAGFRAHLAALAEGEAASLTSHLDTTWQDLERGFTDWLRQAR